MNLKRCDKGHFYDQDKFSACPHCSGGASSGEEMNSTVRYTAGETQGATIGSTIAYTNDMGATFDSIPTNKPGQATVQSSSLADFVKQQQSVSPTASSTTAGVEEEEDEGKTQRYDNEKSIDPVVGWLVCVKGEEAGKSYEIHTGRNFIGRGSDMDIVIKGDKSISRDRHAIVLFDPRKCVFIVQPGESRELFYVNDDVVLSSALLKAYDKLILGKTELLFVPFCSENFKWDEADD